MKADQNFGERVAAGVAKRRESRVARLREVVTRNEAAAAAGNLEATCAVQRAEDLIAAIARGTEVD